MEVGRISVMMTVAEYNRVKALTERDIAKPFVREKISNGHIDRCPSCGVAVDKNGKFCPMCGQRIDTDNIAF